jgi:hypothetical protein
MAQALRPKPGGPDKMSCTVVEKSTGKKIVQVVGHATRKYSSQAMSRLNALTALKRKLKRRYNLKEYELKYEEAI